MKNLAVIALCVFIAVAHCEDPNSRSQTKEVIKNHKQLYHDSLMATLVYITERNGELKQTGVYRKSNEIVQTIATAFPDMRELYVYNVYYKKSLQVANITTVEGFSYLRLCGQFGEAALISEGVDPLPLPFGTVNSLNKGNAVGWKSKVQNPIIMPVFIMRDHLDAIYVSFDRSISLEYSVYEKKGDLLIQNERVIGFLQPQIFGSTVFTRIYKLAEYEIPAQACFFK